MLGAHVTAFTDWLKKKNVQTEIVKLEELLQTIKRAKRGDSDLLRFLGFESTNKIDIESLRRVPGSFGLQCQFKTAMLLAMVGVNMDDQMMKNINMYVLSYLEWMIRETAPEERLEMSVGTDDICEVMKDVLTQ